MSDNDVRKKLVELLQDANNPVWKWFPNNASMMQLANYLIAHGITVQEWVSVTERLPTIYDADDDNCVLAIHKATNKRYYHWRSVANNPFDFTYWTRTPRPPKGE